MKYLFLLTILFFVFKPTGAQISQIALVKPNGTTTIHSTFASAYASSADDDYIYLPGGTHDLGGNLNKRLFIYGAGCHPDSSLVTNVTIANLQLNGGVSGSIISGLNLTISMAGIINNLIIENCYLGFTFQAGASCTNCTFRNNIFKSYGSCLYGGAYSIQLQGTNNIIANNLILGRVTSSGGNLYKNNIFNFSESFCNQPHSCQNETFNNNIFRVPSSFYNCFLNNNLGWSISGIDNNNNQGYNNYPGVDLNTVFVSFDGTWTFASNMHLIANSPYEIAGSDGTQLGIYGGSHPTSEGWIPSNPHIYFKNVAEETNASGQLQIHFKVRTN